MKKIVAIILCLAFCVCFVACANKSDVPDGMQIASGDEVAYKLFVPGGWNITGENGIYGAYYSSTDRSSVIMNSFYPEDDMASIDDYWQACKSSYGETYKNVSIVEEDAQIVFGGKAAFKYVFSAEIDTVSYKFMQIITVHNNMFYVFTYTSTAESYDSHLEDVEKTISEFVFR